jgi:hypothetical protein
VSHRSAETVVKMAVQNTHATVRKQRNKRPVFKAWTVSKLLETYRDPRAVLLEIAGKDTKALAAEMQSSLGDAQAERRLCAQAVLPYICQRLPTQIDMRTTKSITLNILSPDEFAEVEKLANNAETPDDAGFSMQLISASPLQETTEQADVTLEPQNPGTAQDRDERPVTPPVASDPPGGYLRPASEWWDSLNGARRQRLEDKPPAPGRSSWERLDNSGCFAPAASEKPK